MSRRVAIVGVALSDIGRVDDLTPFHLHAQAVRRAVADAGLTKADIDGFASTGTGTLAPIEVAEYLGLKPTLDRLDRRRRRHVGDHGRARGRRHRRRARPTWSCSSYGSTTRADLKKGRRTANLSFGARGPDPVRGPLRPHPDRQVRHGDQPPPPRVRHHHGAAGRDRRVAPLQRRVQPRRLLPRADHHRRRAVGADDRRPVHQAAVLHPLRRRLRDRAGGRGPRRRLPRPSRCGCSAPASTCRTRPCRSGPTSPPGRPRCPGPRAFAQAGVTPDDIDLCCIYDAFTFMVLETLEDLGFCAKGEGGPFVSDGKLRLGGALPTNPDGGGLSACHPGMRGPVPAGRGHPPAARRVRGHRRARAPGRRRRAGLRVGHRRLVLRQRHDDPGPPIIRRPAFGIRVSRSEPLRSALPRTTPTERRETLPRHGIATQGLEPHTSSTKPLDRKAAACSRTMGCDRGTPWGSLPAVGGTLLVGGVGDPLSHMNRAEPR